MINLLPDDYKSELRAARTNLILVRYIGIILIAIIFIMAVLYISYTVLQQTMVTAESRIATSATKAGVFNSTKQQVDALSAKLSETKSLLDQEKKFSSLLTTLGSLMPSGTVLESIKLDTASLQNNTPTTLTAYAKDEASAAAIQQNLQTSPLFSQVSLGGTNTTEGINNYPVKVTLSVTFSRSTP